MYVGFVEYPKRKYHADGRVECVTTPEEEEALGEGWEDSPAAFEAKPEPEPEAKPEKKPRKAKE